MNFCFCFQALVLNLARTQSLIDQVPREPEEILGGMKCFLTVEKELTLDSDPMVFSIFSGEAAGQASVQTGILHLQNTFLIKLSGSPY